MRDVRGRPRLQLFADVITGRVVGVGPNLLRVGLLNTVATLLGGDDVRLEVVVADGLTLELVDIAATLAYHGRGQAASWSAKALVGVGGVLRWRAEPFVVSDGAQVRRTFAAELGAGAGLDLDERIVLGRHGEVGGRLESVLCVDLEGEPVIREATSYAGAGPMQRFVRGAAREIRTRLVLGSARAGFEPPAESTVLNLADDGGCVCRTFAAVA